MPCRTLTPPYGGVPFFPPIVQIGAPFFGQPTIVERLPGASDLPEPNGGSLGFLIRSNPDGPSRCSVLMSVGVGVGAPIESSGSPSATPGTLSVSASVVSNFRSHTVGVFASSAARVWTKIYVEEFNANGAFVRAIVGQPAFVVQQGAYYWFGPGETHDTQRASNPILTVTTSLGFTYPVWVDLEGFIEAAGFAGLGGSLASADVVANISAISVCFIH